MFRSKSFESEAPPARRRRLERSFNNDTGRRSVGYRRGGDNGPPPSAPQEGVEKHEEKLRAQFTEFTFHPRMQGYAKLQDRIVLAKPDKLVAEYWETFPHPSVAKDPSEREYVCSCLPVQMAHLARFNCKPHNMPARFERAYRQALDTVADLMALPAKLEFPGLEGLQRVRFQKDKFAGLHYARMGFRTRAQAHHHALQDAKEAWALLLLGGRVLPHDVRLGGKGKLRDKPLTGSQTENAVGRLILMLSHRDLLVLGNVEQMLTRAYLPDTFPIALGFKWCYGFPTEFARKLGAYERFYCFDAKKFDASISDWLVDAAINILRMQFQDGLNSRYDAYWHFVSESLIHPIVQRDDGIRLQKHQGTTSGHCFNTIVQSIITLLLAYTALYKLQPYLDILSTNDPTCVLSLGDDTLMCLGGCLSNLQLMQFVPIVQEAFGVDWGGLKSFSTNVIVDRVPGQFDGVNFLGKYLRADEAFVGGKMRAVATPYRPFQETVERLFYDTFPRKKHKGAAEDRRDAINRTFERALGHYIDAAGNSNTERWLSGLLDWLESLGAEAPEQWSRDIGRRLVLDYSNIGTPVPKPGRWTLTRWAQHTHRPVCEQPVVEGESRARSRSSGAVVGTETYLEGIEHAPASPPDEYYFLWDV